MYIHTHIHFAWGGKHSETAIICAAFISIPGPGVQCRTFQV